MKVIPLHDGRPRLDDIPGRLRYLADSIENGDLETNSVLVIYKVNGMPRGMNYGECVSISERIALLETMKYDIMKDLYGEP